MRAAKVFSKISSNILGDLLRSHQIYLPNTLNVSKILEGEMKRQTKVVASMEH